MPLVMKDPDRTALPRSQIEERLAARAFRLATRDFNGDGAKLAHDAREEIARLRLEAHALRSSLRVLTDAADGLQRAQEGLRDADAGGNAPVATDALVSATDASNSLLRTLEAGDIFSRQLPARVDAL